MLEGTGFKAGERDGYADAMSSKRSRPRPKLSLCLMAQGYQENYLMGYHLSFDRTKRTLLQTQVYQEQNEALKQQRARELIASKENAKNRTLEQKNQTRQGDFDHEI